MAPTNTTPKAPRTLSAEDYRALAERAEKQETHQRQQHRRDRMKRAMGVPQPRWVTEQHAKEAGKQEAAARRIQGTRKPQGQPGWPCGEQLREQRRQAMVRVRNRRRRMPWYPALATVPYGLLTQGAAWVFATVGVAPTATAGVMAGVPAAAAVAASAKADRAWLPEITLGGLASAAVTFWIGATGMSWLVVLAVLLGTITLGTRWWKANPLGPGVAPIEPSVPIAEPEPVTPPLARPREDYAAYWQRYNASPKTGKAANSTLTNRRDTDFAAKFTAELQRGVQTPASLRPVVPELASGLGINRSQLMIEDDPDERGEHFAEVTIITKDPVADIRYYTGPAVTATETDGIVHGAGRYGDGEGELDITMWNDAGMVPTAIIGVTRSGKSCVGNIATTGALSTGLMNLLYIDPKGVSSPELAAIARITILDPENAARAPELINAMLANRRKYGSKHRISKFNPTPQLPGWMALHDEFSELVNRGYRNEALAWTSLVNTVAALGIWPVAMNQAMQESKWGDDQCRQAFASQMIVMRMRTTSDKLIPGLELSPSSLPNRKGIGVYVHDEAARSNVPVQFDFTPEPKETAKHPDAPLSTFDAFHQFNQQPEMIQEDYDAIVSVLGEPVNGRWVVGGANPTHAFPPKDKNGKAGASRAAAAPRTTASGWGAQAAQAAEPSPTVSDDLSDTQRRVLELIEGGTTRTGDLEQALGDKASRATVNRALNELVGANRIHRPAKGEYAVGPEPSE